MQSLTISHFLGKFFLDSSRGQNLRLSTAQLGYKIINRGVDRRSFVVGAETIANYRFIMTIEKPQ